MSGWAGDQRRRSGVEETTARRRTEPAALVASAVETVTGVLEDAGTRGGAAWTALRSPAPEVVVRRWPWAVGAAVAGAAAGAVVALAFGRERDSDGLDPEEVKAVVDRPAGAAEPP